MQNNNEKKFDFEEIVEIWIHRYGRETVSSSKFRSVYFKVEISERYHALKVLIKTIKALGKPKEFFISSRKEHIVEKLIPPEGALEKDKRKRASAAAFQNLNDAITAVYHAEEIASPKEEFVPVEQEKVPEESERLPLLPRDPNQTYDVLDPEMAELLGLIDGR